MSRTAVYPGSFDPVTNGHLDVIQRAASIFDEVVVAIAVNLEKEPFFTVEERKRLVRTAIKKIPNARVDDFSGLLVHYACRIGATVVVRGLRAVSDFEFELQMALMNRRLEPRVETIFLAPKESYSYLSSRLIKEIARLGGSVEGLVPPAVGQALQRRLRGR